MARYKNPIRWVAFSLALGAMFVLATGCPWLQPNGTGKVTTLFSADYSGAKSLDSASRKENDEYVPLEDIESLVVTLTQIVFVPTSELGGGEEGDEVKNNVPPSHELVYEGEMDVNLKDLMGISEIISAADIPADTYGEIRLSISNPRLVLTSDPGVELTNIQLTANGRLFVQEQFEVPEGQDTLVIVEFGGVNVVATGGGDYVLKEFLEVTLNVTDAAVMTFGTIVGLDPDADTLVLEIDGSGDQITVDYSLAEIILDPTVLTLEEFETAVADAETAGTPLQVDLTGTMDVSGVVAADTIMIV